MKNIEKMTLLEIAEAKGKMLLIESFSHTVKPGDVEIFDKPKLVESANGATFKARGILKNVDVSRYTENLNKRIYSKKLWENVVKKKMGEGSVSLTGHPVDEGNPKDICGVWHNLKVGESTPTADLYIVGENGALMLEALDAGAKIGFSSVGFGELNEDGKTVNEESFELERTGDWVLTPSQQVFATSENIMNEQNTVEIDENVIKTGESFQEKITNNKDNNKEVHEMDKLYEGNLKNQVNAIIKEAKKNTDYVEALEDLREAQETTPVELTDTHKKIEKAISIIEEKIQNDISSTKESLIEKEQSIDELNTQLEATNSALTEMTEKYRRLETIIEKIGVDASSEEDSYENLFEDLNQAKINMEEMEKDLKQYDRDTRFRENDIKNLREDRENMEADLIVYDEIYAEAEATIETLNGEISDYAEAYAKAIKHITDLEEAISNEGYDVESFKDELTEKKDKKEQEEEPEDEKDKEDDKDAEKDDKKDKKDKDDKKDKEDDDGEEMEEGAIDGKVDTDDEEDVIADAKESVIKKNSIVEEYYTQAVADNSALEEIKEEILNSDSLINAIKLVEKYNNKSGDDQIIKVENNKPVKNKPLWLEGRI